MKEKKQRQIDRKKKTNDTQKESNTERQKQRNKINKERKKERKRGTTKTLQALIVQVHFFTMAYKHISSSIHTSGCLF